MSSAAMKLSPGETRSVRLPDGRHTAEAPLVEHGMPDPAAMEILEHPPTLIAVDLSAHATSRPSNEAAAARERALWGEA
jgi:hypothetical protein